MIYKEGRKVSALYYLGKAVQKVYSIGKVVWQALRGCFGSGQWENGEAWENEQEWNNGI